MAVEMISVHLPAGFDPRRHRAALIKKIGETYGDGFEIDSIDPATNTAQASRQVAITEVSSGSTRTGSTKEVNLASGTKPADGDKMAAKLEAAHPGYMMTTFSPFTGKAVLTKLDEPSARCRDAVSAAIGVKPWMVQVKPRPDGGFDLELPSSYSPSKHDKKLDEVATSAVGREGWWVSVNVQKLRASIIPADPPTFPAVLPYAFDAPIDRFRLGDESWAKIPLGLQLQKPGETDPRPFFIDLEAAPHTQVSGTSGSGKVSTLDTPVPVPVSVRFPTGWAMVGELRAGDKLFGADGATIELLGLSDLVQVPMFDVRFSDGQTVRVGGEHLWKTSSAQQRTNTNKLSPTAQTARTARAATLRSYAGSLKPGLFGQATEIAQIAGVRDKYVRTLIRDNDISSETAWIMRPTYRSGRRIVRHVLMDAALRHLADVGLGTYIDPARHIGEWVPVRHIAKVTGLGSTKTQIRKLRDRLRRAGVADKEMLADVARRPGSQTQQVRLHPVAEVLTLIADAHMYIYEGDSWIASGSSVVSTAVMASAVEVSAGPHGTQRNWSVQLAEPVVGIGADLPIAPYTLGAWLGDGDSRGGRFTGIDPEITDEISNDGFHVKHHAGGMTHNIQGLTTRIRTANLFRNKHIPAVYLRASSEQRLAVLQGLMDTDGTISTNGNCELTLCNEQLAKGAHELIRSLGIKCAMNSGPAQITETIDGDKVRRTVGTRWRMHFSTTEPVFRLPRKLARLRAISRKTQGNLYIESIEPAGTHPGKCLRVSAADGMYLTNGFIPTHNSVTLNAFIAGVLARGAELAVVDDKNKAVDFYWVRKFCRPGGWGADSLPAAVTAMALIYQEGERRAKLCQNAGVTNWKDLPRSIKIAPIVVIVDELTSLFFPEKVPKGLPKDHPLITEPTEINLQKATLEKWIKKCAAELRFVGIKLVLSSQVSSTNTGVDTSLRMNLSNKILLGVNPTAGNRRLSLADAGASPEVPANIKADGPAGRGAGVAELEGQEPCVFKTAYATVDQYAAWLTSLGLPMTASPAPTPAQIALNTPYLDTGGDDEAQSYGTPTRAMQNTGLGADWMTDPETGERLTGYAKANAARQTATTQARG